MSWAHMDPAVRRAISAKGGKAVTRETHQRSGSVAAAILWRCDCGRVVRGPSAFQHSAACASGGALERLGFVDFGLAAGVGKVA